MLLFFSLSEWKFLLYFVSAYFRCPYYLSKELHKFVDIVFAPYNYLIDRGYRKSLQLSWSNSILIFDEAHNLVRRNITNLWLEIKICCINDSSIKCQPVHAIFNVSLFTMLNYWNLFMLFKFICDYFQSAICVIEIYSSDSICFLLLAGKHMCWCSLLWLAFLAFNCLHFWGRKLYWPFNRKKR